MDSLKPIETKLAEAFKGVPALPESTKKMLSDWLRWVVLGVGVLQLFAAWSLLAWGRDVNRAVETISSYSSAFGVAAPIEKLSIFYWLSIVVLLAEAIILLMAYPKLKTKAKDGWNLVFLAALINVAYGVFSVFSNRGGIMSLIFSLLGSAIGLYFLFQVRDQYNAKTVTAAKTPKLATK